MCVNFVPHCLALEQREVRGTSWQDVIAMADADKHISNKRKSSEWVGETSPRLKVLKFQRSSINKTLTDFRLSTRCSKRIRTRGINGKCKIL